MGAGVCARSPAFVKSAPKFSYTSAERSGGEAIQPAITSPLRRRTARERADIIAALTDMPLIPGTRLGHYEVIAAIGAGGMGEVHRARDTRLNRDVALKVLPEAVASDAERLARFETRSAAPCLAESFEHRARVWSGAGGCEICVGDGAGGGGRPLPAHRPWSASARRGVRAHGSARCADG